MRDTEIDRRKSPRVSISSPDRQDDPNQLVLSNVSAGGVCLWLPAPWPMDRPGKLRFRWEGQEQVLPVWPVWLSKHFTALDTNNVVRRQGWLLGCAFASAGAGAVGNAFLSNIPPGTHIAVDLLEENDISLPTRREPVVAAPPGLPSERIDVVKAAAQEILPIAARYFAEAHLTITRERLELSATSRSLAELDSLQEAEADRRAIRVNHARGLPQSTQAPQNAVTRQVPGSPLIRRRPLLLMAAGLLAVILGWRLLPALPRGERGSPGVKVAIDTRPLPVWAADLNPGAREGWRDLQARFALSDATMSSAVRFFKVNDSYPPGHLYHDLRGDPAAIARAFRLLAGLAATRESDLKGLRKDLEMRLVSGARFPDEPAGERHLTMSREIQDNATVLAVIDLLNRRQNDPPVKALLSTLWQGPRM